MITIVIFGATGDLTQRKLIPALFHQACKGRLPQDVQIVGFARRPYDHEAFRAHTFERGWKPLPLWCVQKINPL